MKKGILDEEKARALLLGPRRGSAPTPPPTGIASPPQPHQAASPQPQVTSPPQAHQVASPPTPTAKSTPVARKGAAPAAVPAPPPPPPISKVTKSTNYALEQLLNEPVDAVNIDTFDLGDLDITNVDINFEEIEDYQVVKEALLKGVDLRQYSMQIESSLSQVDKESVGDYFAERENFVKLYYQLGDVDGVLGKFEELLSNFQRDLRSISSEIRNLQSQTMSMNMKLKNRKNVEDRVAKFVEDISITQDLRDHITKDDVNESYLKYLIFLDKKVSLSSTYKNNGAIAVADTESHQQKLLSKAVTKVRNYLFSTVVGYRSFAERKSRQQELVPLGYLFQFLFKHASQAANDLVSSYVESCTSFYTNFYKNYAYSFDRTKDADATKTEYLTSSSNKLKNVANFIATKVHIGGSSHTKNAMITFFALGGRADILSQLDQPPQEAPSSGHLLSSLSSHSLAPPSQPSPTGLSHSPSFGSSSSSSPVSSAPTTPSASQAPPSPIPAHHELSGASANNSVPSTKHPYEMIFRNILLQLMDIVSTENKFVVDFFLAGDDVSLAIFGKCINIMTECLTSYLNNTSDIVGMMLILCISNRYLKVIGERRVTVLDPMFQKQAQLVLFHIQRVMNENQENLKQATIKELKPIDVSPHIVTRRFADLLASVSVLLPQLPDDASKSISSSFKSLRTETDKLLQKMSEELSDAKTKTAFLIANYGFMYTIIQDREIPPTDPVTGPSRKIFDRFSSQFIDEQVNTFKYFVAMINFVKEWSPLVESGVRIDEASNPKFNINAVEQILKDFDVNWKLGMEEIKKNIRKQFAQSPSTSAQMLELVLEHLHNHYKQLTGIVNKCFKQLKTSSFFRPEQVMNDMRALAAM
eukprot:Phypoly_transcript_02616.p1 GENE.Phypoly_transcript_02616~~Phypoly_transcript_02616.p1  ORF type:complete len:870 (+),score=202.79 Phypoly_transcript_02616:98-2707(+)